MNTQDAIPLTPAQRKALMYADERTGDIDCTTRVGNSLVRKGYAREIIGFEITKAGKKRVATGPCERCGVMSPLIADPYESDVHNTRVMTYLCGQHEADRANDI